MALTDRPRLQLNPRLARDSFAAPRLARITRVPQGVRAAQHALASRCSVASAHSPLPHAPVPPPPLPCSHATKAFYRGKIPLGEATLYLVRHRAHRDLNKHWFTFEAAEEREQKQLPRLPSAPFLPSLEDTLSAPGELSLSERTIKWGEAYQLHSERRKEQTNPPPSRPPLLPPPSSLHHAGLLEEITTEDTFSSKGFSSRGSPKGVSPRRRRVCSSSHLTQYIEAEAGRRGKSARPLQPCWGEESLFILPEDPPSLPPFEVEGCRQTSPEGGEGGGSDLSDGEAAYPSDTREHILQTLASLSCFIGLSQEQLSVVLTRGCIKVVSRYSTVYREGIRGSCFFVILKGKVSVTASWERSPTIIHSGQCFGKEALLTIRRTHTASTIGECEILHFDANELLRELPLDLSEVRAEVMSQLLTKTPFFKPLSSRVLQRVARISEMEAFKEFQVIFKQGDRGDKMYIVIEGKVCLHIGQRGVGYVSGATERNWFGEFALLNSAARSASATSVDQTWVLTISRDNFKLLLSMMPALRKLFAHDSMAMSSYNRNRTRRSSVENLYQLIEDHNQKSLESEEQTKQEDASSPVNIASRPVPSERKNGTNSNGGSTLAEQKPSYLTLDLSTNCYRGPSATIVVEGT